jgi:hypothetical protein
MPVMLTKVEGRGNGIKTVIPNMSDVAKALSRPPQCKSDRGIARFRLTRLR